MNVCLNVIRYFSAPAELSLSCHKAWRLQARDRTFTILSMYINFPQILSNLTSTSVPPRQRLRETYPKEVEVEAVEIETEAISQEKSDKR